MATAPAVVYRYRAVGFTDDVTECQHCGRVDLKGTVRLLVVGPDGDDDGELYAGVVCAARLAGRPAAKTREEARAANRERAALYQQWQAARHSASMDVGDRLLTQLGLERTYRTMRQIEADPVYRETMAAWDAVHPRPGTSAEVAADTRAASTSRSR